MVFFFCSFCVFRVIFSFLVCALRTIVFTLPVYVCFVWVSQKMTFNSLTIQWKRRHQPIQGTTSTYYMRIKSALFFLSVCLLWYVTAGDFSFCVCFFYCLVRSYKRVLKTNIQLFTFPFQSVFGMVEGWRYTYRIDGRLKLARI